MNALTVAIRNRLTGDTTLTAMLSVYRGGPAIFTVEPIPGDATLPCIVASGHVADVPFDTFGTTGREITRDIRCYTANDGSRIALSDIVERVRFLFHQVQLPVTGQQNVMTTVQRLHHNLDDDVAYGAVVTIVSLLI